MRGQPNRRPRTGAEASAISSRRAQAETRLGIESSGQGIQAAGSLQVGATLFSQLYENTNNHAFQYPAALLTFTADRSLPAGIIHPQEARIRISTPYYVMQAEFGQYQPKYHIGQ